MALHSLSSPSAFLNITFCPNVAKKDTSISRSSHHGHSHGHRRRRFLWLVSAAAELAALESLNFDSSGLAVAEAASHEELWAAARLRTSSFHQFQPSTLGVEDHKRHLSELEFEALKERVAGKRTGFRRVSCINATLPLSKVSTLSQDLCDACKFPGNGYDRIVVGTLDLNQCIRLPDEITGKKPQGIEADFLRAYLSNVCVAKELQQKGLGYALVAKSKMIAQQWGITDLYVHVAVDNEAAKKLYSKSGFIYESDEPAWQARFLDRPRRLLLWHAIPASPDLQTDYAFHDSFAP